MYRLGERGRFMNTYIDDKVKRAMEEEVLYLQIAENVGLDADSYRTRDELKKAIFCMVNVHHTMGLSCAKASKMRLKPYEYEHALDLLVDINEKIGAVDFDNLDKYSEAYENFAHPDGIMLMGELDESSLVEEITEDLDVMKEVAIMLGILSAPDLDFLEVLKQMIPRSESMKQAGEMCALSYDEGINPYTTYESLEELNNSLDWTNIDVDECPRYSKYMEYCNQYFHVQMRDFEEIIKHITTSVKSEPSVSTHHGIPEGKADFSWEDSLETEERQQFERAMELMEDIDFEEMDAFITNVYGLQEMEELLLTYDVDATEFDDPITFTEALMDAAGGPENIDEKALVHLIGLITDAPLEYAESTDQVMEGLYYIYRGEYMLGRSIAKALDCGENPFAFESGIQLIKYSSVEEENPEDFPRTCAYDKMVKGNIQEHQHRLGYTGLVAEQSGIMVSDNDTLDMVLVNIFYDAIAHEEPGSICAALMDFGEDPYAGYESIQQMELETNFFEKFVSAISEETLAYSMSKTAQYMNIKEDFMDWYLDNCKIVK